MQSSKHAANSAEKFGGKSSDYLRIHTFLDSSKAHMNDARHRALTHNSWFIREVIPQIFGETITNSDNELVSTVEIAEQHVLEDFGMLFVPTPQDFLVSMNLEDWMDNAHNNSVPPSRQKVKGKSKVVEPSVPPRTPRPSGFGGRDRACANAGRGVID